MSKPAHRYKPGDTVWIIATKLAEGTCHHCGTRYQDEHGDVVLKGTVESVMEGRTYIRYSVAVGSATTLEYHVDSIGAFATQAEAEAALAAGTETQNE